LALRLAVDPLFAGIDLAQAMDRHGLAGRASAQVQEFIAGPVAGALASHPGRAGQATLRV